MLFDMSFGIGGRDAVEVVGVVSVVVNHMNAFWFRGGEGAPAQHNKIE